MLAFNSPEGERVIRNDVPPQPATDAEIVLYLYGLLDPLKTKAVSEQAKTDTVLTQKIARARGFVRSTFGRRL